MLPNRTSLETRIEKSQMRSKNDRKQKKVKKDSKIKIKLHSQKNKRKDSHNILNIFN